MVKECNVCGKSFARSQGLKRHLLTIHKKTITTTCRICPAQFISEEDLQSHICLRHIPKTCGFCKKSFLQSSNYNQHMKAHRFTCGECNTSFSRMDNLKTHMRTHHSNIIGGGALQPSNEETTTRKALGKAVSIHKFKVEKGDLINFMMKMRATVLGKLITDLEKLKGLKWFIAIEVRFIKPLVVHGVRDITSWFCSNTHLLLDQAGLRNQYQQVQDQLTNKIELFVQSGSGWVFEELTSFHLHIAHYKPLAASSYIDLPAKLKATKAVLNIKNNDQKCFLWCVLAHLHPVSREDNANRVTKYQRFQNEIDLNNITFPMTLEQIDKFEAQNSININVFGYEDEEVFPLKISKGLYQTHVDLLFISNVDNAHYCLIRNLNRLLSSLTKHDGQAHYCRYCLHRFRYERTLIEHKSLCMKYKAQKISYPAEGENILKFKNHKYSIPVPFRIYADFESFICKVEDNAGANTRKLSHHVPSGFAYVIVDFYGNLCSEPTVYRGCDAVDVFLKHLLADEEKLTHIMKNVVPIVMTPKDWDDFHNATHCSLCEEPLGEDRVKDHCHFTGMYRQTLHSDCNVNFKKPTHIPVIFHNLKKYDTHLIMQCVGNIKDRKISCIAKNMEDYISFSIGNLRFLDSFQFMPASLDTLVQNLKDGGREKFQLTCEYFNGKEVDLLLQKGVFPYEYMDCADRFLEESLPAKEHFYSSLTLEHISDDLYEHAQHVWNSFEVKNLGEYQDLYVLCDVLLLSDVFESFRKLCFQNDGIDPCHVYTAPGLSFESCLKMTKINLELFTSPDMHLFIESGIRGGISMITQRKANSNHHYLKTFDSSQPSKFIIYWDCTNLYGYAMCQRLPTSGFRWLSEDELIAFQKDLEAGLIDEDGEDGFILCVDLNYPKYLHNDHNDYPLAVEKLVITPDMLSPYCKNLAEDLNLSTNSKISKLVPNLNDKYNYVIHFRNLKQCLSLGLQLKKIHKILTFKQSAWMKPYIDFNTQKRKEAKNTFERDFYKLKINSIFGKTMQNLRKHIRLELVTTEKRAGKLIASPAFKRFRMFSNDLVGIHSIPRNILLDKPMYVGYSVLELSKHLMYDFHYNFVRKQYGDRAKLILTDTDSLIYEITTEDLYKDLEQHQDLFDNSVYPDTHPLHSEENMKQVGKFKDEHAGTYITEAIAIRPKLYSLLEESGKEKNVGKGVVRASMKHYITHEAYKETIDMKIIKTVPMSTIRSRDHDLYTIETNKIALCPFDNKRYILDDGISSLAYGHFKTHCDDVDDVEML